MKKKLSLLLVSAVLLSMVALAQRAAFAQVQLPLGKTLQDHICWKKRVCTGAALVGQCQPQGVLCLSGTCGDPGDGCSWSYNWACYESCEETCTHVRWEEIGQDCGPKCKWLSYNQCACACQGPLGVNTVEGGAYDQCN